MKNYIVLFFLILLMGCKSNNKQQEQSVVKENTLANQFEESDLNDYSQYRDVTGLVDAKEFHRLIQECDSVFIIDARPYDVFETSAHIKGAHVIKGNGHLRIMTKDLNKKQCIMVYCEKEVRSPYVVKSLINAGFINVYELQGGLDAWEAAGFKLVEKKQKIKRQYLG